MYSVLTRKKFNACYIIWYFRARIKDLEGQGHFQKGHFRLRRALWLSKKAPRPSKKRHKGQKRKKKKGSKFKGVGGGGGGGTPTHFFSRLQLRAKWEKGTLFLAVSNPIFLRGITANNKGNRRPWPSINSSPGI